MTEVRIGVRPRVAEPCLCLSFERGAHLRLVRGRRDSDARPDEIEDEVIWERASVGEAARLDPARGWIGCRDVRTQLGEEPALADTWLAEDRGDPALSRPHDRERVTQARQ